jgi:hypothetical protein
MIMEKVYWLGRKRASLKAAQNAASAEARLIHYDLAGRYSLMALSAGTQATDFSDALPPAIHASGASDAVMVRSSG